MKIENTRTISLNEAADKLLIVRTPQEASAALIQLRETLDSGTVSETNRRNMVASIGRRVRHRALRYAEEDAGCFPQSYPAFDELKSLLNELQLVSPKNTRRDEDVAATAALAPLYETIDPGSSMDTIRTAVSAITSYLDEHPAMKEAGYRRLCIGVEDIILGQFLERMENCLDRVFCRDFTASLLSAVDANLSYGTHALDFLYYSDNFFESLTAENIVEEEDDERLSEKLEVYKAALARLPMQTAFSYMEALRYSLATELLGELRKYRVTDKRKQAHFMQCLEQILGNELYPDGNEKNSIEGVFETIFSFQAAALSDCAETRGHYWSNAYYCCRKTPRYSLPLQGFAVGMFICKVVENVVQDGNELSKRAKRLLDMLLSLTYAPELVTEKEHIEDDFFLPECEREHTPGDVYDPF